MQPFTRVVGPAAPFVRPNVDTDVIIRIERIAELKASELGPYAFEALRYNPDGMERPDFVLNQPVFRGAPILIGGANFGCGSSREAAVWALMGSGLRVVIAESFGDIFFANCFQNGLLPIILKAEVVQALAEAAQGGAAFEVDLCAQTIVAPQQQVVPFQIDTQRREALLEGLDEIDRTLKRDAEIWPGRPTTRQCAPGFGV